MKTFLPALCATALMSLSSCSNNGSQNSDLTNAVIVGADMRACACCGGYFIKVDTTTYRAYSFPTGQLSDADLASLPLPIAMRYHIPESRCLPDLIQVDSVVKR